MHSASRHSLCSSIKRWLYFSYSVCCSAYPCRSPTVTVPPSSTISLSFRDSQEDGWAENPHSSSPSRNAPKLSVCLPFPFCLKKFGIKEDAHRHVRMGSPLRLFSVSATQTPGASPSSSSCIVYGVAFDFFNVSGGLYVDARTDPAQRSSAQGLFMLMTNGIGASIGTFIAGTCVVNKLVYAPGLDATRQLAGWRESWFIFAAYAMAVAILFALIFKGEQERPRRDNRGGGRQELRMSQSLAATQMSDNPSIPYDDKILCPRHQADSHSSGRRIGPLLPCTPSERGR